MADVFVDIGLIVILATLVGYLARLIKQPLIPAYIITGIIIGPVLGLITDMEVIASLSEIGIAFLLFIVGLELDLSKLKEVAFVAVAGGILQMFLFFMFGYLISLMLGFVSLAAAYIGIILAFSSTIVVIKILSDKKELDTLHARIIIGILLMQDLFAILALAMLSSLDFSFITITLSFAKVFVLIFLAFASIKFLFVRLFKMIASSQEMLFLSALAIAFGFSILSTYIGKILVFIFSFAPAHILASLSPGVSITIGAFVAGVALANSDYHLQIIAHIKSLKNFFAIIFFVSIGTEITTGSFGLILWPTLIFLGFVLIIKPLLYMTIISFFGYTNKPSFLSSISLAQVSEFALIISAQGLMAGHITREIFSLAVILAAVTMVLTSYFMNYDKKIYDWMSGFLKVFEKLSKNKHEYGYESKDDGKYDVVLCGYDRIGYSIYKTVKKQKRKILIVDFNPEVISKLKDNHVPSMYGDVGDLEIIERMNLEDAKMLVSTIPVRDDNLLLIEKAKSLNKKLMIFVTSNHLDDALKLYKAGADYVILPHFLGGDQVSVLINKVGTDVSKMLKTKVSHLKELRSRKELGHEYPIHG